MLDEISKKLTDAGLPAGKHWATGVAEHGGRVAEYRDWYDGRHPQRMSRRMRRILQVDRRDDRHQPEQRIQRFILNYCATVINRVANRLIVDSIAANDGNEMTDKWLDDLLGRNHFAALQNEAHVAALRDGHAWLMAGYDNDARDVRVMLETAWNGNTGMLAVMDDVGEKIRAAVKVWRSGDKRMVNIYFPDRVEYYVVIDGDDALKQRADTATIPFIPVVRLASDNVYGSQLDNMIPLQRGLNISMVSIAAASILNGFPLFVGKGMKIPEVLEPGTVISVGADEGTDRKGWADNMDAAARAAMLAQVSLEKIEAADLMPMINTANFIIQQISILTSITIPGLMGGDNQSGEALKERDKNLLDKARRLQATLGQGWEEAAGLIARTWNEWHGSEPVPDTRFTVQWRNAEVRNDAEIRETANTLHEWGFTREALRKLGTGGIATYTEEDIDRLMDEQRQDNAAGFAALLPPAIVEGEAPNPVV